MVDSYREITYILRILEATIKTYINSNTEDYSQAFHSSTEKILEIARRKQYSKRKLSVTMLVVSQHPNLKITKQNLPAKTVSNKQIKMKIDKYIKSWKKLFKKKQFEKEQCTNVSNLIKKALKATQNLARKIGEPIIEKLDEKMFFQWEKAFSQQISAGNFPLKRFIDAIFEDVANVFGMEIPNDVMLRGYRALDKIENMQEFFLHGMIIEEVKVKEIKKNYFSIMPIANKLNQVSDWKAYFEAKKHSYFPQQHDILNKYQLALLSSQVTQEDTEKLNTMFKELVDKKVAIAVAGDVFNTTIAFSPSLQNQYLAYHRTQYFQGIEKFTVVFQRVPNQPQLFLSLKQMFFLSFQVKKNKIMLAFRACFNFSSIANMLESIEKQLFG